MQELIEANTPEQQTVAINTILNKTNEAIVAVLSSKDLLIEKSNQLRNHELVAAENETFGHMKLGEDLTLDPLTKQAVVSKEPLNAAMSTHNVEVEAHPDIRIKLDEIPKTVGAPMITGPGTVKSGVATDFELSAVAFIPGATISRLHVIMPDGTVVAKSGGNVVNNAAQFSLTFEGDDLSTKQIKMQAFDSFGSPSEYSTFDVVISTNSIPVLTALVCDGVPAILEPNRQYAFKLLGGVDEDGDALGYTITKPVGSPLIFSQMTNINSATELTVMLASGAVRGVDSSFTVTGTDNRFMGTASKVFTIKANSLPDVAGMACNIPYFLNPSTTYEVSFTGASDADGSALVFDIVCNQDVVFDLASGLSMNQVFHFTTPVDFVPGSDVVFTVTVYDTDNGIVEKIFSHKVNTAPDLSACVYNIESIMTPDSANVISISGGVDAEGQAVTYQLSTNCAYATLSKEMGIANGEQVTLTIEDAEAVRGQSYNLVIRAVDTVGGFNEVVKVFTINRAINTAAIAINNLAAIVKPNHTVSCNITGATDGDVSQTIKYTIESSDPAVTFSKSSNLLAGEAFNVIIGSVARNSDIIFTVTATDGLETAIVPVKTVKVNVLPDLNNLAHNIPSRMYPGQTLPVSFTGVVDTTLNGSLTIGLSVGDGNVVFAKTTGIAVGETISLSCPSGASRGGTSMVTVTFSDGIESVITTLEVDINRLPVVTGLALTGLPAFITNDNSYVLSLAGATDPDGQGLTYSVESNVPSLITYSKAAGLVEAEAFTMYTDSLTQNTTVNLTVTVSDGLESVTKSFSTVVNSVPVSTNVELVLASILKPNTTYPNTVVYGASDVDTPPQNLTYTISCDLPGITFSKSTGLTANEAFDVIVAVDAIRGATAVFTVTVTDGLETTSRTFNKKINILPLVASVAINSIPAIVKPGTSHAVTLTGAVDMDAGQSLTYSIVSDDPNVTFSKSAGLVATESFNVIFAAGTTRGSAPVFTVTVTDGLESSSVQLMPTEVNTLPVASAAVANGLPANLNGGTPYAFNITGGVDADGQAITYSITDVTGMTFSKTTGITPGESITVTPAKVATNTARSFNIKATDALGEVSVANKAVNVTVLPVYTTNAPSITYPTNGAVVPQLAAGQTYTITVSAYASTLNMS